jgi:CBS-domain-containing membrane protein
MEYNNSWRYEAAKEGIMLTAGEVMTKDVVTVKKETSIRELAGIFTTRRISCAPVVDDAGTLIGIVTETDLVEQDKSLHIPTVISIFDWVIYLESGKKFEKELKKMTGQTVGDVYSREVETVAPSTPISDVADIMSSRKIHAIPVVEGHKVVGIVARIDLIRTMIWQA